MADPVGHKRMNQAEGRGEIAVTDELILRLLRQGDLRALDLIARVHGDRVMSVLVSVLGDRASAEDICHDVLVKLYEGRHDCRDIEAFPAWLLRVARNLALDHLRRRDRGNRIVEFLGRLRPGSRGVLPKPAPEPIEDLANRELEERFEIALANLAEPFRTAFLLREREGMSYLEIAEILGVAEKTVSSRLFRARRELQDALRPYLEERRKGGRP
ncbi:MAG: RNA polymerase sigma factor [Planctomycetes bacterium]|nr:RNA polymerase sigma factor [Planctomycetota bacterium]